MSGKNHGAPMAMVKYSHTHRKARERTQPIYHLSLIHILEMQAPGGKRMSARAYLAGKKIEPGTRFGEGM